MMRSALPLRATLAAILLATCATPSLHAASFHRLESVTPMPSESPDWDYVTLDQKRSHLFIGRRGDGVAVYDTAARKLLPTLADSAEGNAIVLAEPFRRGYTVNEDGTSTVFDLETLKTIERIKLGDAADSGTFDAATHQVLVTMSDAQSIAFLDAKTGRRDGTLVLEAHKFDGLAADGEGRVFVAERDRHAIAVIDTRKRVLAAEWPLAGCEEPTGLAYDAERARVFVGCRGKAPVLAVVDASSGKVVATHPIGRGNDGVVYDAQARKVYTANGVDANLVIYDQKDADTYELAEATTTRPYARTMALDRATKKLYLVTAEGTVDPDRKINRGPAPFYPNRYHAGTFTLLTYAPQP